MICKMLDSLKEQQQQPKIPQDARNQKLGKQKLTENQVLEQPEKRKTRESWGKTKHQYVGLIPPNGKTPSRREEAPPWTREARETGHCRAVPQSAQAESATASEESSWRRACKPRRSPRSNSPCFPTQSCLLMTLLEWPPETQGTFLGVSSVLSLG